MKQILKTSIHSAPLSSGIKNTCQAHGIETIGDLAKLTERQLLLFRGVGKTALFQVRGFLTSHGLSLGMEIVEEPHHTITFKAGNSITVEPWIADEARRLISDQRLIFKNFTKDGVIVISINLSDVSFIK